MVASANYLRLQPLVVLFLLSQAMGLALLAAWCLWLFPLLICAVLHPTESVHKLLVFLRMFLRIGAIRRRYFQENFPKQNFPKLGKSRVKGGGQEEKKKANRPTKSAPVV